MAKRRRSTAESNVAVQDASLPIELQVVVRERFRNAQTVHIAAKAVQVDSFLVTFETVAPENPDPSRPMPSVKVLQVVIPLKDANAALIDQQEADAINKDLYHTDEERRTAAQQALEDRSKAIQDWNDSLVDLYAVGSVHTLTISPSAEAAEE